MNLIYTVSGSLASIHPTDGPPHDSTTSLDRAPNQLLRGKRVVIVEDEGLTQLQLRRLLNAAGLIVTAVAADGPAGVEAVLRETPDIVLMDVKMPGEYDGMEAARRILERFSTCVIMLTAYSDYEGEAKRIGARGYIVKPVDGQSLLPKIARAFKSYQQGPRG
jgi:response regulator NasT